MDHFTCTEIDAAPLVDIVLGGLYLLGAVTVAADPGVYDNPGGAIALGLTLGALSGSAAAIGFNKSKRCRAAKRLLAERRVETQGARPEPRPAASAARPVTASLDVVVGLRQYASGNWESWPAGGLHVGLGPRPLRLELGTAAAVDYVFGGSERELMVGVGGMPSRVRPLGGAGYWGLGYSHVKADLGAGSGSSDAGYFRLGVLWQSGNGMDIRFLTGPARTRMDGLKDAVTFVQFSFVHRWGRADGVGRGKMMRRQRR